MGNSLPQPNYDRLLKMRVRDLKLHLLKLGASESEVARRLDKLELVELALFYIEKDESREVYNFFFSLFGVVIVIYVIWELIKYFHVSQLILAYFRPALHKLPSLRYSLKKKLPLAILFLLLSILFDIYEIYVQISILLSWILPSQNVLSQFLAPTLSFPVSLPGRDGSAFNTGLNIGPMITIWISNFIKSRLESRAASIVMGHHRD
jgi:hypothetical protein